MLYILLNIKQIFMLVTNKTLKITCTNFRQVCQQNADKVVTIANTTNRKSTCVRSP